MGLRFLLPPSMLSLVSWKMFPLSMEAHKALLFQLLNLNIFSFFLSEHYYEFIIHGCLLSNLTLMFSGLIDLAMKRNSMIGGDDFKSGQTKMKFVLQDLLVGAGIKVYQIVAFPSILKFGI